MLKWTRNRKAQRIAAISVLLATAAGCTQTTDWLKGRRTAQANDPIILGAPEANSYLQELYDLAAGDPARQAEIFADAESAALLTPGPNTELRFGLVLATPGHPESNPEKAESLLREVLAQSALLTQAEISLATIHLNNVERFIVANSEARRLRQSTSRAARTEEQAVSQRLATVEAENRRLRAELEAAEEKLEAITSIERSIREQE
ncbi:MAG: hypothetical protein KJO09_03440 [Gammaproteobacteria bacterium]|nr:hypothetical protein [Gammaproteobacteria bacterium]